ncbi:Methyltransferase domain-containing protein [Janthinobacterium sp. OK676]|uniref:class I SAM-dependent methyltransferase n=1 Tax=Janthinobacterium sp. OK676 TaxID=1855295 RepID=UPI00088CD184|nr:class I SAM-dependent methyltransferase [Janthinobacterium sp. OK676]SDM81126.1 Methyltransferase domain-containing protein [Janthinobacterium sp. OK676]
MQFFNKFDRFYTTSVTSPFPDRLNGRHAAIIARNSDQLAGKRILDIASHDGRWTFAALQAGAAHVTGIEPRQELIDNAIATFDQYGIDRSRYTFHCGDVFEHLQAQTYDVVLCLGFYYHTVRHAELLDRIERTGATFVIIDTEVIPPGGNAGSAASDDSRLVFNNPNSIQLLREPVDDQQMACSDSLTRNGHTLVGRPSRAAVEYLANHFGYTSQNYDWAAYFADHPEHSATMNDYHKGWRETFYLSRK